MARCSTGRRHSEAPSALGAVNTVELREGQRRSLRNASEGRGGARRSAPSPRRSRADRGWLSSSRERGAGATPRVSGALVLYTP